MYDSIQQFMQEPPVVFENIFKEFYEQTETTMGDVVKRIKTETDRLARNIIVEMFEEMDQAMKNSSFRKEKYEVIRSDEKTLLSTVGPLTYSREYYKKKATGERVHLLDRVLGVTPNTKKTEDVVERILEHAIHNSYRLSGEDATFTEDVVSKQTVMNVLKKQEIPDAIEIRKDRPKKQVKFLYINADEDHVSLQFMKEKGDLAVSEDGYKRNTYMPRLIYVFEDIMPEGEKSKRHRLVGRTCFTEKAASEKPEALWERVMKYMDAEYDMEYLEAVYIIGDGAAWIKGGVQVLGAKARFVLDKFHLSRSINGATAFLGEDCQAARDQIWDTFSLEDKEWLKETFTGIRKHALTEATKKRIDECRTYLMNHWDSIIIRNNESEANMGCSAEGLVSHIFADRLSSRPLGWSKEGANKMVQLRVFESYDGKVIDLLAYKKEKRQLEAKEESLSAYEYGCQGSINENLLSKRAFFGKLMTQVIGL